MKKIVMFSASWCNPCKQAKPVFQQLAESARDMEFEILDIDESHQIAQDFNITGVPTFMLIEDNEEVQRLVGAQNVVRVKEFLTRG
jgi:thioredoxin 1